MKVTMGACKSKPSVENQLISGNAVQPVKNLKNSSISHLKENEMDNETSSILSGHSGQRNPTEYSSNNNDDDSHGNGDKSLSNASSHENRRSSKLFHHSGSCGILDRLDDKIKEEDNALTTNVVNIEFGKPIEEVYDGVHTGQVLGSGVSGIVRLITHRATGIRYAVKILDLGLLKTEESLEQLRSEIYIMCQLDHPNIVRLEEVYESRKEIYLVQELCLGGELFDRLDEQPDYHYTEQQCARLVKQMLCAVRYIHYKKIIHRDLKLENFLFSTRESDSVLKMIDFGLSKHFQFGELHHEAVGTPYTVAPEVIRGSYDERCDVWAMGVITYLLLSGDSPFGGCGGPEPLTTVRDNILKGSFRFLPVDIWRNVSQQAKDFIKNLLVVDPSKRPNTSETQKLPWLKNWAVKETFDNGGNALSPSVVKALVNFKEYSDMRKLLCEVLSFTLIPEQIKDLRKEFEKIDTDGSGEISFVELKKVLLENAGSGSLGALTEEEVEDIFNAMRVRKTETTIHWHEFIAAGLSQCKVDDRNLRLAFDRLDKAHKGYISFDDVLDIFGSDCDGSIESYHKIFLDGLSDCQCKDGNISYDDFLILMKGQTKGQKLSGGMKTESTSDKLFVVPESRSIGGKIEEESAELDEDDVEKEIKNLENIDALDGTDSNQNIERDFESFHQDSRRGIFLPEHDSKNRSRSVHITQYNDLPIATDISNRSSSTLMVNRNLYRAHRQMRLSVLEACKRFDEMQVCRVQQEHQQKLQRDANRTIGAGLVMRHGHSEKISTEAIRKILQDRQNERLKLVEKANKLGGRGGRKRRIKTVSDMSAMLGGTKIEHSKEMLKPSGSPSTEAHRVDSRSCPPSPAIESVQSSQLNYGRNLPFLPNISLE